jgi:hypothetical protein
MRIRIQECKNYPQKYKKAVLRIRIRDLVLFGAKIRDEKKLDRGSRMNVLYLIFENLAFWLKDLRIRVMDLVNPISDTVWKNRIKDHGSATLEKVKKFHFLKCWMFSFFPL